MIRVLLCLLAAALLMACNRHDEQAGSADSERPSTKEAAREPDAGGHDAMPHDKLETGPGKIDAAGITLQSVGPADIRQTVTLFGTVVADPTRRREVPARFPGIATAVRVNVGDRIAAGTTLATVESNESLRSYDVVAPISGTITRRAVNPGEAVGESPLFEVTDLDSALVILEAYPADLARLRPGQAVRVTGSGGDVTTSTRVVAVDAVAKAESQAFDVRVPLAGAARRFSIGQAVDGRVVVSVTKVALAVPASAVQTVNGKSSVFVRIPEGFRIQPVVVGASDGETIEVRDGLHAGDQVAVANSFTLKAEAEKGAGDDD